MTDTLAIATTREPVTTLHLEGRLDSQSHEMLLEAARHLHDDGTRYLLIDLEKLEYIASAGLGALQQIFLLFTPAQEIKSWEAGKHGEPYKSPYFKLADASADVYYVLNLAGFLQNIPIYPDVKAALDSFPTEAYRLSHK